VLEIWAWEFLPIPEAAVESLERNLALVNLLFHPLDGYTHHGFTERFKLHDALGEEGNHVF